MPTDYNSVWVLPEAGPEVRIPKQDICLRNMGSKGVTQGKEGDTEELAIKMLPEDMTGAGSLRA